jgi:hypothetical protein
VHLLERRHLAFALAVDAYTETTYSTD